MYIYYRYTHSHTHIYCIHIGFGIRRPAVACEPVLWSLMFNVPTHPTKATTKRSATQVKLSSTKQSTLIWQMQSIARGMGCGIQSWVEALVCRIPTPDRATSFSSCDQRKC